MKGYNMTNSNTTPENTNTGVNDPVQAGEFVSSIELVIGRRVNWDANERRTSNLMLYGILADCMALYERVKKSRTLYDKLTTYLSDKEIRVGANSSGLGKVVKAVFASNEQHINAYIGVLNIAVKQGKAANEIKDWLIECGGIAAARKKLASKSCGSNSRETEVKRGLDAMATQKPLFAFPGSAALLPRDDDNNTGFVVALLRKDGADLSVVHVFPKLSAAEAMLRRMGASVANDNSAQKSLSQASNAADKAEDSDALFAELQSLTA